MPTSFALFCSHCGAALLRRDTLRPANPCPACGARVGAGGALARGEQLHLPSGEHWRAALGAGRLWLTDAEALWRLTLTDGAPRLASFPLPEHWQAANPQGVFVELGLRRARRSTWQAFWQGLSPSQAAVGTVLTLLGTLAMTYLAYLWLIRPGQ